MKIYKENILVTVYCTVYNHAPYLKECLDGFINQKTNFNFEVIVHDDASIDSSVKIIKEYAAKYPDIIKPIFQIENQYSKHDGSIEKVLSENTRGKYIALCEGDDYWINPYKLQKQVDFLEANNDYSMCFHKAKIINEINQDVCLKSNFIENKDYTAKELFVNWIVPTASMLYKRDVIYYPHKRKERLLNGDINIVLTCAMLGKIRGFDETMSAYRMQTSGVTYDTKLQKSRSLKYPDHFLYIKDNFSRLLSKGIINREISQAYWGRIYNQENKFNKLKDFILAFYYDPKFITERLIERLVNKFRLSNLKE